MINLIVLPFAGSMGFEFRSWGEQLSKNVKVHIINYPGRGMRAGDNYATSWEELLEDVYDQIVKNIGNDEYMLLGHSMGSTILYEIYYRLLESNMKLPSNMFFSGCNPPNVSKTLRLSELCEEDFVDYFVKMGGINDQVLECRELYDMVFETLKSDVNILESYKFQRNHKKIYSNVYVLNGCQDEVYKGKEKWNELVLNPITFYEFTGGHFFIFENEKEVIRLLMDSLFVNKKTRLA